MKLSRVQGFQEAILHPSQELLPQMSQHQNELISCNVIKMAVGNELRENNRTFIGESEVVKQNSKKVLTCI
jgi:hypothetical protein